MSDWRQYIELPLKGKYALTAITFLLLMVELSIYLASSNMSWQLFLGRAILTLAIGGFAWRPPTAAVTIVLVSLLELTHGTNPEHVLYLVGAAGLVRYTCSLAATIAYCGVGSGLAAAAWAMSDELTGLAPIVLTALGALSVFVGWTLRNARNREDKAASELKYIAAERVAEIQAERNRIADELHDIIAHEVTLIALHAEVLERVEDDSLRDKSLATIKSCSHQALADIRRVLNIVRVDGSDTSGGSHNMDIHTTLDSTSTELQGLGAKVHFQVDRDAAVPVSISNTLSHIARESATNITKHSRDLSRIEISFIADPGEFRLIISNPVSQSAEEEVELPSSGSGLARLEERAHLLGGTLEAGIVGATWVTCARFPVI